MHGIVPGMRVVRRRKLFVHRRVHCLSVCLRICVRNWFAGEEYLVKVARTCATRAFLREGDLVRRRMIAGLCDESGNVFVPMPFSEMGLFVKNGCLARVFVCLYVRVSIEEYGLNVLPRVPYTRATHVALRE